MRSILAAAMLAGSLTAAIGAEAKPPLDCTIIVDAGTAETLLRQGTCDQRFSPNSSFKLPLAVMGFDSGILKGPHDPLWTLKAEYKPSKRDLNYREVDPALWEKESVVWFSQNLTRKLGAGRFADYVAKFRYGNQDVSGDPGKDNGLTQAWLMSSLAISPDEQIDFLRRFKAHELSVAEDAYSLTEATIATYEAADGWSVQGKSGSGWLRDGKGRIDRSKPIGWFVGWAEKDGREILFARLLVGAERSEVPGGIRAREGILAELPKLVGG